MGKKRRKDEKRSDPVHLKAAISNVKKEIDCLLGKQGCEHRLEQLQNVTLPKLQRQYAQLSHA